MLDPDARDNQKRAEAIFRGANMRARGALLELPPDKDPNFAARAFFKLTGMS